MLTGPSSKDPKEVLKKLQELHDQGVIDLNAPLRDVIPFLERQMATYRRKLALRGTAEARKPGYCFVGDRSWFSHDPEE